jgi:hypothetical protein
MLHVEIPKLKQEAAHAERTNSNMSAGEHAARTDTNMKKHWQTGSLR